MLSPGATAGVAVGAAVGGALLAAAAVMFVLRRRLKKRFLKQKEAEVKIFGCKNWMAPYNAWLHMGYMSGCDEPWCQS